LWKLGAAEVVAEFSEVVGDLDSEGCKFSGEVVIPQSYKNYLQLMIQELITYTDRVLNDFKEHGLRPKDGLHVVVSFDPEGAARVQLPPEMARRTDAHVSEYLLDCARHEQRAWMIDTWKCLDAPEKEIHAVSPYCLAFKRAAWMGGEAYVKKQAEGKKPLDQRIGRYFDRAITLLEAEQERERQVALQFKHFCQNELAELLAGLPEYEKLKETDYIVVYLGEPQASLADYERVNNRYLRDKLFNTEEQNTTPDADGQVFGTSNFFTSYGDKKPFLVHQTAPFGTNAARSPAASGIGYRISDQQARLLNDFRLLADRNPRILPNPLPVFVDISELENDTANRLNKKVVSIFNEEPTVVPGYREIMTRLLKEGHDLNNYYLLFYQRGEIRDFDYVSHFATGLRDERQDTDYWQVRDLFGIQHEVKAHDVFELQTRLLKPIFNNALVQEQKSGAWAYKYFDDIDPKYCSATTFRLAMQYRQAWYDFVYKSRRQAVTGAAWRDMLLSGILEGVAQANGYQVKQKLNIYLSLNHLFDSTNSNFTGHFMPTYLPELRESLTRLLADEATDQHLATDEDFAFAAGQLIYYLLYQSKTEDKSNELLEPFLQKTNAALFKEALAQTIRRYKHAISFNNRRFRKLAEEVLGYHAARSPKELMPFILCGYFSPSGLFIKKKAEANNAPADAAETPEDTEN
jgi:CRISPR-associated protein Csh1